MSLLYIVILLVALIALAIYFAWRNSPKQKGKRGEQRVAAVLAKLPEEYMVLNDVVFPTDKGTTQIDHIVLSQYGLFAIETKNYTGDIYGDDNRKEWTQVIATDVTYGKKWHKTYTYITKNRFYNPVKQAYGHVFRIKDLLNDYPRLHIIPVVVFAGSANLGNVTSNCNVIYIEQLISLIKSYNTPCVSDPDIPIIMNRLLKANIRQTVDDKTHVRNLRRAEQETLNTIQSGICPRCGGKLTQRSGKYGSFYGCSNYPNCKFTTK